MKIKNWETFQHFKDRTPPWIKLYRDLLNDPEWFSLDPEAAKTLVMLWLIASEDKTKTGSLPDSKVLAFRLHMTEKQIDINLKRLEKWLIHDDIILASNVYHGDTPERAGEETETETETETEAKKLTRDNFRVKAKEDNQGRLTDDELEKFCAYWLELSKSGKKARFEDQRFFELSKRIGTWAANAKSRESFRPQEKRGTAFVDHTISDEEFTKGWGK